MIFLVCRRGWQAREVVELRVEWKSLRRDDLLGGGGTGSRRFDRDPTPPQGCTLGSAHEPTAPFRPERSFAKAFVPAAREVTTGATTPRGGDDDVRTGTR